MIVNVASTITSSLGMDSGILTQITRGSTLKLSESMDSEITTSLNLYSAMNIEDWMI